MSNQNPSGTIKNTDSPTMTLNDAAHTDRALDSTSQSNFTATQDISDIGTPTDTTQHNEHHIAASSQEAIQDNPIVLQQTELRPSTAPADLKEHAEQTAKRFIRNVVIIDNEAYMGAEPHGDHPIDAAAATKFFAQNQINCSVYRPEEGENIEEIGSILIQQCDAAIVDWQLSKKGNKTKACKDLIKRILTKDEANGHPFRLIIIYSDTDPHNGVPELKKHLEGIKEIETMTENNRIIFGKNLRIVFIKKLRGEAVNDPSGLSPESHDPTLSLPPSELPNEVIRRFAELAGGILPSAALHAISSLRERSHIFLSMFREELDPLFLLHAACIKNIDDAWLFLKSLFKDEALGILDTDNDIICTNELIINCYDTIKCFHAPDKPETPLLPSDFKKHLFENGNNIGKNAHKIYSKYQLIHEFCRLSTLKQEAYSPYRSLADDYLPMLTQGTIIRLTGPSPEYYVCIIPQCDSVRREQNVRFPFIQLEQLDTGKFADIYVLDNNQDVGLKFPPRETQIEEETTNGKIQKRSLKLKTWDSIVIIEFNIEKDRLLATKSDRDYIFTDVNEKLYNWIANIKEHCFVEHLQKIINEVERIGTDQFGWLHNVRAGAIGKEYLKPQVIAKGQKSAKTKTNTE
jgi:hypothetical protein